VAHGSELPTSGVRVLLKLVGRRLAIKPIRQSRGGAIVMVKPSERGYADNDHRISASFEYALHGNLLPKSLMRSPAGHVNPLGASLRD